EAVSMMRRTGDVPGVAIIINTAGVIQLELGAPGNAVPHFEESVALADSVTPLHAIGWQQLLLAHIRQTMGDANGSALATAEALARFEALGDEWGQSALQRACKAGAITMPL